MADIGMDLAELEALLDDVLDAARLEVAAGEAKPGFALRLEDVEPERLARAAEERFRSHHPGRPFEVAIEDGLPAVRADPMLFRRVLDNLLENADKYSPDPKSEVRLHVARANEGEHDGVSFEVIDTGMGIAAKDLPRVFAPFFRAEKSRSRGTGGVGLGLTLAQRITAAHGGAIDVRSEDGAGTRVTVVVPSRAP